MSSTDSSQILEDFLKVVERKNLALYPAQEEAILHLFDGANVILNTPTGSGKSLVAQALHFLSHKSGHKSYYTCPIKALVNEKFIALCQDFGPDNVGMITGDATVNAEAPILCCTAEILSNLALRLGDRAPVNDVIVDEFHYYSDRERGVAWQIPLLTLKQSRFLLMSATLGDTTFFEESLTKLNGRKTEVIRSAERPVPLDFSYQEIPVHQTVEKLVATGRAPVYIVNFTQRECAETAQNLLSVDFCSKDEKRVIADALMSTRFDSPYGKDIQRLLRHGIGIHHAGLLPKYRVLVEKLAQRGLLKLICGTDTLGVGVNVPIRTVLFTKLCKFDGQKTTILTVRDFHQISGRAGRKGFDDQGYVVAQAPEHVIENLKLEEKSQAGKSKNFVKRKPPEKGYVPWNKETFQRLISSQPEALTSQFNINHGMLLNVLSRDHEDGCRAMQRLVRDSHENPSSKKKLSKRGFELFRSLVDRSIVEFAVSSGPRKRLVLNIDLQQDFSLNQSLSLYLLDALKLLDPSDSEHVLNVLTLVEAILENPDVILRKQVDRLKTEKMAEMKMAGIEYDERITELEKIEHPKPLREFVYQSFNEFSDKHPWVGVENIRPKSVAREMYSGFYSFADYIREYDLQRAEGILLRYLSEVYKVLLQTVPEALKTEEILEMISYFRSILQMTDSSLVEEWDRMRNPSAQPEIRASIAFERPEESILKQRAFTIQIRNTVFHVLRALSRGDLDAVGALVPVGPPNTFFTQQLEAFHKEHDRIDLSPNARNPSLLKIHVESVKWIVEQSMSDAEGPTPWVLGFELDVDASKKAQAPVLKLQSLEAISA